MLISDWSSDVCSSDLALGIGQGEKPLPPNLAAGVLPHFDRQYPVPGCEREISGRIGEFGRPKIAIPWRVRDPAGARPPGGDVKRVEIDRKSTRLNSSH